MKFRSQSVSTIDPRKRFRPPNRSVLWTDIPGCNWKADYPGITAIAREPLSYTSGAIDIQLGAGHGNFPWSEYHPSQGCPLQTLPALLKRRSVHLDAKLTTQRSITSSNSDPFVLLELLWVLLRWNCKSFGVAWKNTGWLKFCSKSWSSN